MIRREFTTMSIKWATHTALVKQAEWGESLDDVIQRLLSEQGNKNEQTNKACVGKCRKQSKHSTN